MVPDAHLASDALRKLAAEVVRSFHPKRWFRARYMLELAKFIETGRRSFGCEAAETFFFLDPRGVAYPCPILPFELGDLNKSSYEEYLLFADRVAAEVERCEHGCFMVCTAAPYFRRHPLRSVLGLWK